MPLKNWDTKADFDAGYIINLEPDGHPGNRPAVRGGYERSAVFNENDSRLDFITPVWAALLNHFQWPKSTRIAVIACGFGWSLEFLESRGYTEVWGSDASSHIQSQKTRVDTRSNKTNALSPDKIKSEAFQDAASRDRFVSSTIGTGTFDVVITDHVLETLIDADATALARRLRPMGARLVHIVIPVAPGLDLDPARGNWKTLREWAQLVPRDTFIDDDATHQIVGP